jgi:hypothetical protein
MKKTQKLFLIFILIFLVVFSSCSFNDKDSKEVIEKSQLYYVFECVHTGYHFVTWNYKDYDSDNIRILYEDSDDSLYNLMLSFEYEEIEKPKRFDKYSDFPSYKIMVRVEPGLSEVKKEADKNVNVRIYSFNMISVSYSNYYYDQTRYYSISIDNYNLLIDKLELMRTENNRYSVETKKN